MDHKEALASLETIRTILERSTRYTHIAPSGIISCGIAALCASAFGSRYDLGPGRARSFLLVWGVTLLVALASGLGCSARRARRRGEAFWSRKLQFVVAGAFPPAVAGLLLSAALFDIDRLDLCPGIWMVCYGIAILSVAVVLDWEFRATAWAFLVAGSISMFLLRDYPHLCLGLAFGGLHIALGTFRLAMEGAASCRAQAPSFDSRT
jgi:hypothetical protein